MNLKESIKGNTKKFIDNVVKYLDSYCENEQGWLDMENNILNLQKYTRYHSLNEAIKEYVMGGSLDVYFNQVNDTLNKLYENTPEEAKKWEKYPDEKKWERYIAVMQLYIPKAFKKKMGREMGVNVPEEYTESCKKSVSLVKEKMFNNSIRKFAETLDKDIYPVAKVQCKMIERAMKNGNIERKSLSNLISEFKDLEEKVFLNKMDEKGLTRSERYNRSMDKIFDFAKKLRKAKEDYLIAHGVPEDEVKELSLHTGIGGDALQQKLIDMGIKDDFYKEFKAGMRESKKSGNLKKIKEDYGWEVSYDNIWNLYDDMKEYFGDEELLESIVRAMGTYDLGDILTYICRMNDYNSQYLEGHEEDEEEELDESKKSRMNEDKTFVNYIAVYRDKDECLGYIQNDTPHLTQDVEKAKKFSNEEDARRFASMLRKKGIYDDENEALYVEGLYESKMKEYSSSGTIKNYKPQNNFTKTKNLHESKSDGWPEEVEETFNNVFDSSSRFAYEVQMCVRGGYTNSETLEELAEVARRIGYEWLEAADDLQYVDDPDIDDDEELEESKKIKESIHKINYGEGVIGYGEPGDDTYLFFMGVPCGFKTLEGEVYLDKDCPAAVYRAFSDYKFSNNSFLSHKKKEDIRDYKEEADESLSYEEALKKVHSGEWDSSKFVESVLDNKVNSLSKIEERKLSEFVFFRVYDPNTRETLKDTELYAGKYEWVDGKEFDKLYKEMKDTLNELVEADELGLDEDPVKDKRYHELDSYLSHYYFRFSNRKKAISVLKGLGKTPKDIKSLNIEYWYGPIEPLV